jgi:hypothetical protein
VIDVGCWPKHEPSLAGEALGATPSSTAFSSNGWNPHFAVEPKQTGVDP